VIGDSASPAREMVYVLQSSNETVKDSIISIS